MRAVFILRMTQTPGKEKPPYRLFEANKILGVGQAFILIAIDAPNDTYRDTETYLFVFKDPSPGVHCVKNSARFNGLPRSLVSDEILLSEALEVGEAEAQFYVSKRREELGIQLLPRGEEFEFEETEPERLFYLITRHKIFNLANSIRGTTECKALEQFLQQGRRLSETSVEMNREEPSTLD
jgi:hypothetical protein